MTNVKTYNIAGQTVFVKHASALTAGYGHKKINVELCIDAYPHESKVFSSTTDFMPGFDRANDLEDQERYNALFELIENNIIGRVEEWLIESEK